MKHHVRFLSAFAAAVIIVPAVVYGHFKLLEPASWIIENDRGDPQKTGPCGGSNTDWGKPSNAVTKAAGGQKLHLKVQETIYHPGHYRVALAVNSHNELPLDPRHQTRDGEKRSAVGVGDDSESPADSGSRRGLFVHATRPAGTWSRSKPTSNCPTSAARSARYRSCSSWPSTASTTRVATRITTARRCRSPRTREAAPPRAGRPNADRRLRTLGWKNRKNFPRLFGFLQRRGRQPPAPMKRVGACRPCEGGQQRNAEVARCQRPAANRGLASSWRTRRNSRWRRTSGHSVARML